MRKKWWEVPGICLLMLSLALVSTYPLILHFDTGIPYDSFGGGLTWNRSGDQMQLLYWFWLVKENILGTVPFDTNPFEFNMGQAHDTTGFTTFPVALLFFVFSFLGDITAYNCTILSSYVLAGIFMYLLIRIYTGSRAGALLGAIIFTFAPSRMNGVSGGNLYAWLFFCYPWILFFIEKSIQTTKIRYGFLAGLGLIFLSMLEAHLLYYICVFVAVYIPFRFSTLFPVLQPAIISDRIDAVDERSVWSVPRSVAIIWGSGVVVTLYSQVLFSCRDQNPLFSSYSWWIFALYPLIPVLISLCCSALYQRFTSLGFRSSFAIEAGASLPLYLLLPLAGFACVQAPVDTSILVFSGVILLIAVRLFLLRHYLKTMLAVIFHGLVEKKRVLWALFPVICAMGYIVLYIPSVKVDKFASTIAASGRTLHDVRLYSSHLTDIFSPFSNVYIGIVSALLLAVFFLLLFWSLLFSKQTRKFSQQSELLLLFYGLVAFCSFILALGLAFGKSSLYLFLYYYLPFFNYPRISDRLIALALFALAVMAGFMVQRIQKRCTGPWLIAVSGIVLVAAGLQLKDFNILKPTGLTILDKGQDVYTYVQNNIGDGLLLEIPIWPGDSHQSSLYQHYIMLDRIPRVNGYSPLVRKDYVENIYKPLDALNHGRFGREQYELLQDLGVKYITVHNNRDIFLNKVSPYGPLTTVRRFENSPYLESIDMQNFMYFKDTKYVNDNLFLFKLKDRQNVATDVAEASWYTMPLFYGTYNRLHQQTGEIVEDEHLGRHVFEAIEGRTKPGFLVYGPYANYVPGDYRCVFMIQISEKEGKKEQPNTGGAYRAENSVRLEVVKFLENGEQVVVKEAELQGMSEESLYQREKIDFELDEYAKMEFRVFYHGTGDVRVAQVAVFRQGNDEPLYLLEAFKMVGDTGRLVSAEDSFSGKVVEAIAGKSTKGDMVYGPNRTYGAGQYRARFYMRMKNTGDGKKSDIASRVSVSDSKKAAFYSQREISVEELNEETFTPLDVEFSLDRDEELSFNVTFTGKVSLQLDRIEIERH